MPTGPVPASDAVRDRLRRQRRRDTAPEVALRRELHRRGLRFRVDRTVLPGSRRTADVVFGPARVAVFVDGCFWHSCPEHGIQPRNNHEWWAAKLAGNVARDRDTDRRLRDADWLALRVWEHEQVADAATAIERAVRARRGFPADR